MTNLSAVLAKMNYELLEGTAKRSAASANQHNDNDWCTEAERIAVNAARTALYEILGIEEYDGSKFVYNDQATILTAFREAMGLLEEVRIINASGKYASWDISDALQLHGIGAEQ